MSRMFLYRMLFLFMSCLVAHSAWATESLNTIDDSISTRNFWQLNKLLGYYENAQQNPWPTIPDQPRLLKVGTRSNTVLILRERLRRSGDLDPNEDNGKKVFDQALSEAVSSYQERHGLKVDGVLGEDTREDLNLPPEVRIKQITINMQRWANLAGQLKDRFIIVNIPDFKMHLFDGNHEVLTLRAIVGKRELQTPELKSKITRIVFNPYWNIPPKIARNDIAPKMLMDPNYMNRLHIRAFRTVDNDASEVNPFRIDWQLAAQGGLYFHLRQDPGPENALGLVKFEFQNSHDVYMHDTSAKDLFNNYVRDFSHGCIRLENPFALVEYLLKDDFKWSQERIQEILERGKTTYVPIIQPIPIFITYITVWVDDHGKLNFRNDIYNLDEGVWNPNGEHEMQPINSLSDYPDLYN